MSLSRSADYQPRIFIAGELASALTEILTAVFPPEYGADVSMFRKLPDGTNQSNHRRSIADTSEICDLSSQGSIHVEMGKPLGSLGVATEVTLMIRGDKSSVSISCTAATTEQLSQVIQILETRLLLQRIPDFIGDDTGDEQANDPLWDAIQSLSSRVAELEHTAMAREDLTCFLSFQFTGPSQAYAKVLKHYLSLLGVKVVTGEGYEPRQIQDKVKQRLGANIDIVVLVEAGGTKSAWTRDEIALAQAPGIFLIPLVEEGSTFDRGIFGDHEFIPFPVGRITETLIPLLEGITYVRSARANVDPRPDPES